MFLSFPFWAAGRRPAKKPSFHRRKAKIAGFVGQAQPGCLTSPVIIFSFKTNRVLEQAQLILSKTVFLRQLGFGIGVASQMVCIGSRFQSRSFERATVEVYFMTIVEMLEQSVVLTILGMAVVFAFLWLMIVCVNLMGKVIHKIGLDKDVNQAQAPAARTGTPPQVTAAISAAVNEYRKTEAK
jgi:oxaloacetate decarboxylase gamma subunit